MAGFPDGSTFNPESLVIHGSLDRHRFGLFSQVICPSDRERWGFFMRQYGKWVVSPPLHGQGGSSRGYGIRRRRLAICSLSDSIASRVSSFIAECSATICRACRRQIVFIHDPNCSCPSKSIALENKASSSSVSVIVKFLRGMVFFFSNPKPLLQC